MSFSRSMRRWRAAAIACSIVVFAGFPAPGVAAPATGAPAAGPLVFAGGGASPQTVRILADAFGRRHPDVRIETPPSIGSAGAIRAVLDGAITVGLISRGLRDSEQKLGVTVVPYTRTVIAVTAHPSVPDGGITSAELVEIYEGKKRRWRDGHEIVVLTRQPGNSGIEVLTRRLPAFKVAYDESQRTKRWHTIFTEREMSRTVSRTPYAIGLGDLGVIGTEKLAVKTLAIDGVAPTPDTAHSGAYPFVKPLAFVFVKDRLPPGARAFIEFVRSKDGEKILRALGYLPGE